MSVELRPLSTIAEKDGSRESGLISRKSHYRFCLSLKISKAGLGSVQPTKSSLSLRMEVLTREECARIMGNRDADTVGIGEPRGTLTDNSFSKNSLQITLPPPEQCIHFTHQKPLIFFAGWDPWFKNISNLGNHYRLFINLLLSS